MFEDVGNHLSQLLAAGWRIVVMTIALRQLLLLLNAQLDGPKDAIAVTQHIRHREVAHAVVEEAGMHAAGVVEDGRIVELPGFPIGLGRLQHERGWLRLGRRRR